MFLENLEKCVLLKYENLTVNYSKYVKRKLSKVAGSILENKQKLK